MPISAHRRIARRVAPALILTAAALGLSGCGAAGSASPARPVAASKLCAWAEPVVRNPVKARQFANVTFSQQATGVVVDPKGADAAGSGCTFEPADNSGGTSIDISTLLVVHLFVQNKITTHSYTTVKALDGPGDQFQPEKYDGYVIYTNEGLSDWVQIGNDYFLNIEMAPAGADQTVDTPSQEGFIEGVTEELLDKWKSGDRP